MNTLKLSVLAIVLATSAAHAQVLVYDQQSSTDETYSGPSAIIQFYGSVGQSFTPSLSSVGFVRVKVKDLAPANSIGAALVMRLHSTAINGPIIGTATSLTFGDGFSGSANFVFPTAVPVTPNLTYFFETSVQSGDNWGIATMDFLPGDNYPNGASYGGVGEFPGSDLWFREGIVVPEPSSASMLLLGGGLAAWFAGRKSRS